MPLFHYTRTETAFQIIDSGNLHATHWKYLNDGSEMEAIKPLLQQVFGTEFEEEGRRLIEAGPLKQALIDEHGRRVFGEEAARLIDVAYRVTNNHLPVFLTSFCRHDENSDEAKDGLLSQWRGYGADGGCALEFEEHKLREMISKEAQRFACMHVSLEDVVYRDHERILQNINVDGLARSAMRKIACDLSKENERIFEEGMKGLQTAIGQIAPKLKHPAFSEERETRIILPCMSREAAKEYPKRMVKRINFRFRDGLPIPFVKLFEDKEALPIKRVIVGPQRRQEDVAHTIGLALKARKMATEVECSSIPLVL